MVALPTWCWDSTGSNPCPDYDWQSGERESMISTVRRKTQITSCGKAGGSIPQIGRAHV